MSKGLFGTVVVDRQTAEDDLWLCEPFSRGQAWLDLTLLANDEPRTLMVRGVAVRLEKGQVGRSVVNLADRWQWSREKTRAFLEDLRDRRKITYKMDNVATVITVLDYGVFNREKIHDQTPEPTADQTAEPSAEPTQNSGTVEQGNQNMGTGEATRPEECGFAGDSTGTICGSEQRVFGSGDQGRVARTDGGSSGRKLGDRPPVAPGGRLAKRVGVGVMEAEADFR